MPRCLPLRGAQTRRFRAIPEICALAQSLPHTCCAPVSKVFSGQSRGHGHRVRRSRPCRPRRQQRSRHGHFSILIDSLYISQCLRCSCGPPPPPRMLVRACAARHAAARADPSLCIRRSMWVEQGRREQGRRERRRCEQGRREQQREQQQLLTIAGGMSVVRASVSPARLGRVNGSPGLSVWIGHGLSERDRASECVSSERASALGRRPREPGSMGRASMGGVDPEH